MELAHYVNAAKPRRHDCHVELKARLSTAGYAAG